MSRTISFEQKMKELNNILDKLENEDNSLENSIKLYEKGVKLTSCCYKMLDTAQQKITKINVCKEESENEQ